MWVRFFVGRVCVWQDMALVLMWQPFVSWFHGDQLVMYCFLQASSLHGVLTIDGSETCGFRREDEASTYSNTHRLPSSQISLGLAQLSPNPLALSRTVPLSPEFVPLPLYVPTLRPLSTLCALGAHHVCFYPPGTPKLRNPQNPNNSN